MAAFPLERDIDYPESDGRPLGETDIHRREILDLIDELERRYEAVPDVYIAGNLFVYYEKGKRSAVVCPDVFVVFGASKGDRRTFRIWEEGVAPSFVIEITSESTENEDVVEKKEKYLRLGVKEYFLFDPLDEYLSPQLQGFRLVGARYQRIVPEADGSLMSQVTGLRLRTEGERLRLLDAATGEPLLRIKEERAASAAAVQAAEAKASEEATARRAAEAKVSEEATARRAAEARAAAAEEELARLRRALDERHL
jgi:Uma2 family endonuclease